MRVSASAALRTLVIAGSLAALAAGLLSVPSAAVAATQGECVVHSLPGFIAQGAGANAAAIADVVEVGCHQESGQPVTIEDAQLDARCGNVLHWAQPLPYATASGVSFNTNLDSHGNAIAVMWTHGCLGGSTTVSAKLGVAPNTTTSTTFAVLPAQSTPQGLETLPRKQTEIAGGGVATIVEAEVTRGALNKFEFAASNLFHRCRVKPHLHWIYEGKERTGGRFARVTLDNDGNGFAVVLGGPECQVGESLVTGELVNSPYTAFVTSFQLLPAEEVL